MTQDFAKIKPEPILERKILESPPTWSLLLTGGLVGVTVGVLACVLFYLSGRVPPLNIARDIENVAPAKPLDQETEDLLSDNTVDLEFYTELPKYVVQTDAVPVELKEPVPQNLQNETQIRQVMLQTFPYFNLRFDRISPTHLFWQSCGKNLTYWMVIILRTPL